MEVAVWDTYVARADGKIMHFDILVDSAMEDTKKVFEFGKTYLSTKSFDTGEINSKSCSFCHIEHANPELESAILESGFSIIEMQNCD
ncbi:MAG TPA: DUF2024 family protein [Fulvivirga sp.]|nr:DUF2024 family protein [Fulvivirga sp.]